MEFRRVLFRSFYEFLRRFGYGESTESGFPGEAAGLFPPPSRWSGPTKQTLSYGYGISVTPLQIAPAYAALANDGLMIEPTFVKGQQQESRQVTDPESQHYVMAMRKTGT